MHDIIGKYVPSDTVKNVLLEDYVNKFFMQKNVNERLYVLDLGCGIGETYRYFKSLHANIVWVGLDIENSPEVMSRKMDNEKFIFFNGIDIPFEENYFDLIYCRQVLEHVRFPRELLKDVYRVLKPEGQFIGSTSHLEPFHSMSYWNYTPYGFSVLMEEAKLKLVELRPGIDSLTLIIRRGLGSIKLLNLFFKIQSPLNSMVNIIGKILGISFKKLNTIKLLFCGQFIFWAIKPKK